MKRDPGPTSTASFVQRGVFGSTHHLQVLESIVSAIPVDVMNNIVKSKRTDYQKLLGYPSVFRHASTVGQFDVDISSYLYGRTVVISSAARSVAEQRAESPQFPASSLGEGLSTDLTYPGLWSRALRRLGACARAVAVWATATLSAGLGEGRSALFAGKLKGHRVLLTLGAKPSVGDTAGGLSLPQFYKTGA